MTSLKKSITINGMELHNRLVMPPMATAKCEEDGKVTQALCEYYNEKATGGYIGLIITEHCFIHPAGKAHKGQLSIAEDSDIEGLKKITDIIHNHSTKTVAQISHAGKVATGLLPEQLSKQDIQTIISDFAVAAGRVKQAGYDGVEIHCAHGYLLNQFYSPLTNHRQDEYSGSSLKGRLRLPVEVLQAVRDAVGKDYPVAMRLGGCDYQEGGTTIADSVFAAQELEKEGLDLLDVSGGFCGFTYPGATGQGYFSEITQAIKDKISIPVILTGGIVEAACAQELLEQGKADLIGVGRAILKDSEWAKKAMA